MNTTTKLFLFLLVLGTGSSCRKQTPVQLNSDKEITGFKLELTHNTGSIEKDIEGKITGNAIVLVLTKETDLTKLKATFVTSGKSVTVANVKQESMVTVNDFSKPLNYQVTAEDGSQRTYTVTCEWKISVPHVYIQTANNTPVTSKDDYLQADIQITGSTAYPDYTGTTKIKGRGNSTWNLPKKPYRLKLDKKASILGLAEEKDWVLLANYIDPTLMCNAVAMKTGQLLQIPYTNHIIPVDVTINGTYMGSYSLTEQVAVSKNRVNIEDGGVLMELDVYFDEPWKFTSSNYNLPVMIKYPDLTSNDQLNLIKDDFQLMENTIFNNGFPNNNYTDHFDINALVNYFIVYNLTGNEELNHPKSVYLYKPKNGKYTMGPLWDFDWAYGFEGSGTHFKTFDRPLFWNSSAIGTTFFTRLLSDPKVKTLYKQKWTAFKADKLPELLTYIDRYANTIETSQKKDYDKWGNSSGNFSADVLKMRNWIKNRATYIDQYVAGF
ncbi:CotH kinase family protein [Pedobacter nyackensis]|uniref:CotH kinase family protein n=1 Tax=Pedobacter nyackensis TaxID=475255 RepID=UPI002931BCBE|nr:CotH kinase family protein [Pedobacter nyackensis]